jgi:hypothetical protein
VVKRETQEGTFITELYFKHKEAPSRMIRISGGKKRNTKRWQNTRRHLPGWFIFQV